VAVAARRAKLSLVGVGMAVGAIRKAQPDELPGGLAGIVDLLAVTILTLNRSVTTL